MLDLLRLPESRFRRQDVFAWLAAAPILHEGRLAPVTAWERISRDAAVVAGRADWDTRLTQLALQSEERADEAERSEEHTSELQSLMRISYAVFCLKKKKENTNEQQQLYTQ